MGGTYYMHQIEIRRPKIEDIEQLKALFSVVIHDTYMKEGLGEKLNDIREEIKVKEKYLENDFKSNGKERFFLIAVDDARIIGSIEFGQASNLINECTNNQFRGLLEVGTLFVHPGYQRQGIGNLLLKNIYSSLLNKGFEEFCLDSGYSRAQTIWTRKFGEPNYFLKDYWGQDNHHMIWKVRINDCI